MNVQRGRGRPRGKYTNTCAYVRHPPPTYAPEVCGKDCMRDERCYDCSKLKEQQKCPGMGCVKWTSAASGYCTICARKYNKPPSLAEKKKELETMYAEKLGLFQKQIEEAEEDNTRLKDLISDLKTAMKLEADKLKLEKE